MPPFLRRLLSLILPWLKIRFTRMHLYTAAACCCCGLLLPSAAVFGQQYHFKNYSVEDGVAQSQVYALFEDSRGYLWMGTRGGGLTRFDGLNFKTYTVKDGLADNYIWCIAEDAAHRLLIGTNKGLSIYTEEGFKNYNLSDDGAPIYVQTIVDGKWMGTNKGLYYLDNGEPLPWKAFPKENILSLFQDKQGDIWAATYASGMAFISKTDNYAKPIHYATGSGLGKSVIQAVNEDKNHKILACTYDLGVFQFNNGHFSPWIKNNPLSKKRILAIHPDTQGNIWFATLGDGVCKWNASDSSFTFLTEMEGLANNHVRCIIEDTRGNFWFGTSGGGVSRYSGQPFIHFTKNNGLSGSFAYSVFRDSHDRLWIGSGDKGVCMYDGKSFTPYSENEGFHNYKIRAIAEDKDSMIWFGTDGQGVYVFDENTFFPVPELKGKYIRAILRDKKQNMWVATVGAGIYKLSTGDRKNKYQVLHFKGKALPADRITALAEDNQGRIWFGAETEGIGYIADDTVRKTYTTKDGLPSNAIRCLTLDNNGNLWAGTTAAGISMIKIKGSVSFENYDTEKGLHSSNIYLISPDAEGNLYVGSESGLDKLRLDAESHVLDIKHLGRNEGFIGIETCQNAVFRDKNGWIWFGTVSGLTAYNPNNKQKNLLPPIVHISGISLFYKPLDSAVYTSRNAPGDHADSVLFVLPHNQNLLTFDFDAINLSAPENVQFRWKLDGFDNNWSPASFRRDATYSNLAPGEYAFQVIACNEDGVWNKEPVSVHFTILKPFWMKLWFLACSLLLLLLLILLIFRWRLQVIKRKAQTAHEKVETEKTLIELEQKALRLQMNPHFIFNALNSIQSQITENNEQTARHYLAKFSKLMRMILENSQQTEISLAEEIRTLENYLSLEKFSSDDQFDYELHVAPSIDAEELYLPPMMIQPFVENAIIHGLKHLTHRGRIQIEFLLTQYCLECRINDNGIGRKQASGNKAQQESHHKSTALIVTQQRLDRLRGPAHEKLLEIIDKEDENGIPMGTTVVIRIPLK
jgi:ligand-binding sensor domain-containing protein